MKRKIVYIALFFISFTLFGPTASLESPEGISPEMYCVGCELTVKELDFVLRRRPTRGMGETVTRALKAVCKLDNFRKHEMDAKKVLKVCKHIIGNEEMEAVLISEYGRKHELGQKTTYLDMTKKICGKVLNACPIADILDVEDEDGGIIFNTETEDFEIKYGSKVRTPNPVRHGEPQLHKQEQELHKQDTIDLQKQELSHMHKHEEL